MKGILIIIGCFTSGILIAYYFTIPEWCHSPILQSTVLAFLLFLVGIGIGCEKGIRKLFSNISIPMLFLPFLIIGGSLIGGYLASYLTSEVTNKEGIAIASGMGYYSLSSILLSKLCNEQIGAMALIANLFREISTILLFPLIAKFFGRIGGIASGGATAMDTTLPLIVRHSGKEMAVIAIYSGLVITLLVPIIISVIMG